jgi:hypothetical protein
MGDYPFGPPVAGGSAGAVTVTVTGADPTGATFSDTAFAAAFAALGSGQGTIALPAGTYKISGQYVLGVKQNFTSPGATINYYGTGTFLHQYDAAFNAGNISTTVSLGGTISGILIDGTNAGSAAIGFMHGDMNSPTPSVSVQNFTGATAIGVCIDSVIGWTNWGTFNFNVANCTDSLVLRNTSGLNIVGGAIINGRIFHNPNQNGIVTQGGAAFTACGVNISIASACGVANTGTALSIAQDNLGGGFVECSPFNINMEADQAAGTVGPVSIAAGTSFAFYGNVGQLRIYGNGAASYKQSTGLQSFQFSLAGIIDCNTPGDFLGKAGQVGVGLTVMGGIMETPANVVFSGGGSIFNGGGNMSAITLASGAQTLTLSTLIPGFAQRFILIGKQPPTGAKGTLTFPGAITDLGGGAVLLSTANGAVDIIDLFTPDGVNTYATVRARGVSAAAGAASISVPSNSAGSAPILTALGSVSGTSIQLSDTTRDYMVYLEITTAGTATTVEIGHTAAASDVLIMSAGAVSAGVVAFRLPAGWWFKWTGTVTAIANQNAVGC